MVFDWIANAVDAGIRGAPVNLKPFPGLVGATQRIALIT